MTGSLLATKLIVPLIHPNLVPRFRLMDRLDEGWRLGQRLTLVSAPAGFGKTTLLTAWARRLEEAATRVSWLSLDEGDNDPVRFFSYLVAALQRIDGTLGQAFQSLLGKPHLPPVETLMTVLINDIVTASTPCVLVLDDYHLIRAPFIHEALGFLLEHQPQCIHLAVATRIDPPLSLSRLRVHRQMTEIRADDLRFTPEEAALFLNRVSGLSCDAQTVAVLETRTEGWVAGLQLAALSLRGTQDVEGFVSAFDGSHRHVIDYLASEVLARQTESLRDFLCQTSILDRLTAPLCDAVTGRDDSAQVLEHLEQANLFLVPLDDQRVWYRYHRLFADFLYSELAPQQAASLHLRAACWFEESKLLSQAVKHALAHAASSGNTDEAVRLVRLAAGQALSDGELATLLGWLEALPDQVVRADVDLTVLQAWVLFMVGDIELGMSYLHSAEMRLTEDTHPVTRGRFLGLRCYVVESRQVLSLAEQALDLIGEADPLARGGVLLALGNAQQDAGDVIKAAQTFREAFVLGQMHDYRLNATIALGHLAFTLNAQGRRREAVALCRRGIEQYVDGRGNPLPITGLVYVALGELAYEANDLDQAQHYLRQAIELGRQSGMARVVLSSLVTMAWLQLAREETVALLDTLREVSRLASQADTHLWLDVSAAIEADFDLRRGNLPIVGQWGERVDSMDDSSNLIHKHVHRVYVRVLLAQERADEALALLARLEQAARQTGRQRGLITISIQQALAHQMLGEREEALTCLKQALYLAAPEDYRRAFLDEGLSVVRLLPQARSAAPAFVADLLTAFAVETKRAALAPALVEPLSERELEVLRLIAAGFSSPEIANAFFIAVSTVKSHRKSIYGKLGVHSRREAIERAKALGLL